MIESGVSPNVTFITLLAACADSGLVDIARNILSIMDQQYSIF